MSSSSQYTQEIVREVNEGARALPVEMITRLNKELEGSLCMVQNKKRQGTGALVALPLTNSETVNTFVTCNHVLGSNDRSEIHKMKLVFTAAKMKMVRILPEWYSRVWNSSEQYYDATIIEFNAIGTDALHHLGAKFLAVDKPLVGQRVVMFQYPKGELSLDGNIIESITVIDGINQIMYHIGADDGSSGSPILTYEGKVVGVHRRRIEPSVKPTNDPLGFERHAIDINQMIDAFVEDRFRCQFLILNLLTYYSNVSSF